MRPLLSTSCSPYRFDFYHVSHAISACPIIYLDSQYAAQLPFRAQLYVVGSWVILLMSASTVTSSDLPQSWSHSSGDGYGRAGLSPVSPRAHLQIFGLLVPHGHPMFHIRRRYHVYIVLYLPRALFLTEPIICRNCCNSPDKSNVSQKGPRDHPCLAQHVSAQSVPTAEGSSSSCSHAFMVKSRLEYPTQKVLGATLLLNLDLSWRAEAVSPAGMCVVTWWCWIIPRQTVRPGLGLPGTARSARFGLAQTLTSGYFLDCQARHIRYTWRRRRQQVDYSGTMLHSMP